MPGARPATIAEYIDAAPPAAHLNFAPSQAALAHFEAQLKPYKTTKNYLQLAYDEPLPEALIRRIAAYQLELARARQDDAFW